MGCEPERRRLFVAVCKRIIATSRHATHKLLISLELEALPENCRPTFI
jgi:hypothetical protein